MSLFTLFGTDGCHLCEEAEEILHAAGVDFQSVDIMTDDDWREKYGLLIPVLRHEKSLRQLAWPFDGLAVKAFLSEVNRVGSN